VTHHLRPATQGLPAAIAHGAWIAAPAGEAKLLAEADRFWNEAPLRNMYIFKPSRVTPATPVNIAKELKGGRKLTWEGINFEIIDTPGPTAGAVSLVATIDGRRVAFTGELIVNDGQLPNYWNMQYTYGDYGKPGLRATQRSLHRVRKEDPDVLLPSRGPAIDNPEEAIAAFDERADKVLELFDAKPLSGSLFANNDHPLPHLYWSKGSYLLTGQDGNAILIGQSGIDVDGYGGPEWLNRLRKNGVFNNIDAVFLLSYQDDHIAGAQAVATTFGCPIYTSVQVMQGLRSMGPDPFANFLAQQYEGRVRVNIVETGSGVKSMMKWDNYLLRFLPFGGHSFHQMGLFTVIDGEKVMFTGDSVRAADPLSGDFNCYNALEAPGYTYLDAAQWLEKLRPDKAATMRDGVLDLTPASIAQYRKWAAAIEPTLLPLLASRTYREGLAPDACHAIVPFQMTLRPPNQQRIKIIARNAKKGPLNAQYRFVLPPGWQLLTRSKTDRNVFVESSDIIRARAKSLTLWTEDVRLAPPENLPPGRTVIPIDVVDDGLYLGQIMHLIVDHGHQPPLAWTPASGMTPYEYAKKKHGLWDWLPGRMAGQSRVLWAEMW
ncbi:MAG TPA: hypothetical protein PK961_12990, partial [bacterium]|nr:hypothetical protein [bacterium]